MYIIRCSLLLLLANIAIVLASPAPDNAASSIISAFCTRPSSNFKPAVLSSVSQFCIRYLNIKTSTVQVTSTTISTASGSAGGTSITIVTVRTGSTITVTPPPTTVTIPSTFTEPGTTETVTAAQSTITVISRTTITTGVATTVFTGTSTVTQTKCVTKRQNAEAGILANHVDSVISSVCKCVAKTPTVTRTSTVTNTQTVNPSPATIITSYTTIAGTVTTELDEFTRSIFTTVTLPGEDETISVTLPVTTVTSTSRTVYTTTNTVKTIKTTTATVRTCTK